MVPETRYAKSGAVHIAYQVMGDGPIDLVYVPGWISHLELEIEGGASRRFYDSLAAFSRLIRFDKRGTGMSDPQMGPAALDERVEDIKAVMDAAGVGKAALFGSSEGGTMAAVFAARYPERVDKLILFASHAGKVRGSEDFPCGYKAEPMLEWMQSLIENRWGEGASLEHLAPSVWKSRSSSRARARMARFERMAATPGAAMAHFAFNMTNDSRPQMASVTAPTLVLHRAGDHFVPLCNGDHLAAMIPNARLVVMEGEDHLPFVGDVGRLVGEVEMFLTGSSQPFESHKGGALSPHDPVGGLTDAELRVASLVADGLSNAAIAAALHIFRHTVESHLKHSFSKLEQVGACPVRLASDSHRPEHAPRVSLTCRRVTT